jgi:hypothetical protein
MAESTSIIVPKTMPLSQRISEVNRRLSEWFETLEIPFNVEKDAFHLNKCEKSTNSYRYYYSITRDARLSGE